MTKRQKALNFIKTQISLDLYPFIDERWTKRNMVTFDHEALDALEYNQLKSLERSKTNHFFKLADNGGLGTAIIFK